MRTSRNKTRYLILGLLNEGPLSGYDIKKIVDWRFSYFWSESYGQIYPELARLEAEGLIGACKADEGSRKDKKRYQIKSEGLIELKKWLAEPAEKEVVRIELLLKLYFSNLTAPEVMADQVKEFEISHKRQLELFKQFEQQLAETKQLGDNHDEILMVLSFGQKVLVSYVEWSRDVIKKLEEKR